MKRIATITTIFCLSSCSSSDVILRPQGTFAKILLNNDMSVRAELLGIQDGGLILAADSVAIVEEGAVRSIELDIEVSRAWVWYVIIFEAVPSLMTFGFEDRDDRWIPYMGLAFTGLTAYTFYASELDRTFEFPLSDKEREVLRARARHPFRLSADQLEEIGVSRLK